MKKTVLLTGFEPFNGATINPAWEAVRALKGWIEDDFIVEILQLPCVFGFANRVLCGAVDEIKPDIVICVGQAGGRADLTVERVAINVDDAPILDNDGQQPVDAPIALAGPGGLFRDAAGEGDRRRHARAGTAGVGVADGGHLRVQSRVLWVDAPSAGARCDRRLHSCAVFAGAGGRRRWR